MGLTGCPGGELRGLGGAPACGLGPWASSLVSVTTGLHDLSLHFLFHEYTTGAGRVCTLGFNMLWVYGQVNRTNNTMSQRILSQQKHFPWILVRFPQKWLQDKDFSTNALFGRRSQEAPEGNRKARLGREGRRQRVCHRWTSWLLWVSSVMLTEGVEHATWGPGRAGYAPIPMSLSLGGNSQGPEIPNASGP